MPHKIIEGKHMFFEEGFENRQVKSKSEVIFSHEPEIDFMKPKINKEPVPESHADEILKR